MNAIFEYLFGAASYMPHGYCLLWRPDLVAMHAISDGMIALSYFSIPLVLAMFVSQRKDFQYRWLIGMFAAFILLCGTTHLIGLITLWWPVYGAQGLIKAGTAAISVMTAFMLWPLLPKVVALPSPAQLQDANLDLQKALEEKSKLISELEEAHSKIEQDRKLLAAILENISEGIVARDAGGEVIFFNRAASDISGIDFAAMPSLSAVDPSKTGLHLSDGSREITIEELPAYQASRGQTIKDEEYLIRQDGRDDRYVRINAQPLMDETNTITGTVATLHDFTQERETTSRLSRTQRLDAIGQLTSGIAHDFNNLLSTILGNLQLLQRSLKDDNNKMCVEACLRATRNGTQLVSHLSTFANQQPIEMSVVSIEDHFENVLPILRRTIRSSIDLDFVCQDSTLQTYCDVSQLENAILNLVLNARDSLSHKDGGKITVAASGLDLQVDGAKGDPYVLPRGRYAVISVSDNGAGMTDAVREKAFEPFFSTKDTGAGTGLGLAMVYGFTKKMNGSVRIDSAPGVGTTVKLYLPAVRAQTDGVETSQDTEGEGLGVPLGHGEPVLVVEDRADVLQMSVSLVRDLGYEALSATNAPEALNILDRRRDISIVFSDIVLPGNMSGVELANRILRDFDHMHIVLTTGGVQNELPDLAKVKYQVLRKPFTRLALARALKQDMSGDH